jgi:FHS family Na+ dependent glucose MFS transporter 1
MTSSTHQPSATDATLRRQQTVAYYAAFVLLGMVMASLGPTLPRLAAHTGTEIEEISFLFMGRSLGTVAGALLGGRLYDRRPGHPIIVAVLALMGLMLLLTPLIPLLWLLTLVLFLLGMGEGTLDVGTNTLLVWVHGAKVAPYMNGLHFFFGVGTFFSPLIFAQSLLRSGDITWGYWVLALLVLPLMLYVWRVPAPEYRRTDTDSDGTRQQDNLLVLLIALFLGLYVGTEVGFSGWIASYALAMGLTGEAAAAYLTSGFWGAFTFGRLLSIPLAARVRPRTILLVDLSGSLLSVGVLLLWPGSLVLTWAATLSLGLFLAATFPTTLAVAERRLTITGRVTSWFFVGASSGAMTIPWLIGQLFARRGPQATIVAIFVDLIAAVGVVALLLWRSADRRPGWQAQE